MERHNTASLPSETPELLRNGQRASQLQLSRPTADKQRSGERRDMEAYAGQHLEWKATAREDYASIRLGYLEVAAQGHMLTSYRRYTRYSERVS